MSLPGKTTPRLSPWARRRADDTTQLERSLQNMELWKVCQLVNTKNPVSTVLALISSIKHAKNPATTLLNKTARRTAAFTAMCVFVV